MPTCPIEVTLADLLTDLEDAAGLNRLSGAGQNARGSYRDLRTAARCQRLPERSRHGERGNAGRLTWLPLAGSVYRYGWPAVFARPAE